MPKFRLEPFLLHILFALIIILLTILFVSSEISKMKHEAVVSMYSKPTWPDITTEETTSETSEETSETDEYSDFEDDYEDEYEEDYEE